MDTYVIFKHNLYINLIAPIYEKGNKRGCISYGDITLCKIFSKILPSKLIPYAEETIGDHQYRFRRNGSTTAFVKYLRKSRNKMRSYINYVYTLRQPMIQLEGRSCTKFSLSLVHSWATKANKNVCE
jgi:hypothetical protein